MTFRSPYMLLLLLLLPTLVVVWRWRRGYVPPLALALRLLAALLVIVALANPIVLRSVALQGLLVLLVDQSDSLGEEGKAALRDQASALAQAHTGPSRVLYFGGDVAAETAAAPPLAPNAEHTDIAGALHAARALLDTSGGRIVLLSDGAQTRGDALAEAQALHAAGVPVDTIAYRPPGGAAEIWLAGVDVPRTLREGEEYAVTLLIGSSSTATAQVALFEGERALITQQVALSPGDNRLTYHTRAGQPGIVRLRATVEGRPDTFARNNSLAATALVASRPRVLLIEGREGNAATLRAALRPAGILAETIDAAGAPAQLSALAAYEGIVLIDVPASSLTLDQMATLREFVRSEGHGLVVTGGRSSFTLGAYKDTPLEEALPVMMTPPPRPQRPAVTLLLIIDQSASMGPATGRSKFDMAKESAILATESLRDEDRIGVLSFDTTHRWAVDFQMLGTGLSLGQIQERIGQIAIGGGTDIYAALNVGLNALAAQPGQVRHAVLLTDGRSFSTERGPYRVLINEARARNITLSAIAIGQDSDTALLKDLAQWGAGRYYFAGQPADIPRLTLMESRIASAEPQVEGDFRADLAAPHPILRDFAPNQIPRLGGYVATTVKPEAELVLHSPEQDPVLAVWQYGLGRAVAWTPSVDAPWAELWPNWPEYGGFWAQLIRYTLPEPDSGALQVRVAPNNGAVTISADAIAANGEPFDLADTEATLILPHGAARQIPLRQIAPGRYTQDVTLPEDGAYAIEVRQRKGAELRVASAGYVQQYPAEYLPARDGAALLARISAATGGLALDNLDSPAPSPLQTGEDEPGLWLWLLIGAALLWPIEIAVRRGLL